MTTNERIVVYLEACLVLAEKAAEIADDCSEMDFEPLPAYDEVVKALDAVYLSLKHVRRMCE